LPTGRRDPGGEQEDILSAAATEDVGLFTPPTTAMRLDPRFGPLADGLGLTDYWRRRHTGPDAFLFET
jgi:hypothetical protein